MTIEKKVLRILEKSGEIRLRDLVKKVGASRQMVHRVVAKLLQEGLVQKRGTAPRTRYRLVNKHQKPFDDTRIFWDTDVEKLDYQHHARSIIERVFERGDVADIRNCRRYYGDEKIRDVLLSAKFLPETRMYLASAVINRPLKDFRCYILRQSNPTLFPY